LAKDDDIFIYNEVV